MPRAAVLESKRLASLQDDRGEALLRMEAILDEADGAELSAEQSAEYDRLQADVTALDKRIEREEKFLEQRGASARVIKSVAGDGSDEETRVNAGGKTNVGRVKDAAAEDPKRGFKSHREYLACVAAADSGRRMDARLRPLQVGATAGSDEQQTQAEQYGGYLVPEGFLPNFLRVEPEPDPTGATTKVPMATPVVKLPARVDKNHSTSVSGGLTVTRREETGSLVSSLMSVDQVRLEATGMFGLSYCSEEVLSMSAISFFALIEQGFRDQFQYAMIDEKLNGTGVGQYLGVMNSPALISVAKESGQATNTLVVNNILKMRARSWRYSKSVWLANHDTLPQLASLALAAGSSVILVYMPSIREDVPDMLLGRPIIFTEYCKTLGSQGDIVLVDWSQYLEGQYQPLQSAESVHVRFLNHERAFKFWMMNAGAPWWKSALTPKNSTSTLSPFVTLDQRP